MENVRLVNLPVDTESCPVDRTLRVLDGRWSTLIVRDLLAGPMRFGDLRRSLTGISPKTLIARLRHLEELGIVTHRRFNEVPPRVEYELTEAGVTLERVLVAMWHWGHDRLIEEELQDVDSNEPPIPAPRNGWSVWERR